MLNAGFVIVFIADWELPTRFTDNRQPATINCKLPHLYILTLAVVGYGNCFIAGFVVKRIVVNV